MGIHVQLCCRYAIGGDQEEWEKVKINGGSNIINVRNEASTKKRKLDAANGTAAALIEKVRGTSGIVDPKNVVAKLKAKKAKQKANRDKKKQ